MYLHFFFILNVSSFFVSHFFVRMIKRRRRSKKTANTEKTADTIDPESEED